MEINKLSFSYDKQSDSIKNVTCTVAEGAITTIIGPNGSGKSTLLGLMSRNYAPRHGQIVLDGKALSGYKPKELAKKLAVVHQHNEAPADMTVEKLVGFGRLPHKGMFRQDSSDGEAAVEWALASTNLIGKRQLRIDRLSGGERQRVWIAMALAQKTPILFLDEPTTYLDIYYQFEILELVKKLNAEHGLTIVMVLHDINQAIRYSDNLIVMKEGEVLIMGEPEIVVTPAVMRTVYGVDVKISHDEESGIYMLPLGIHA
ncbi:ABC transporter ATP-binding protein [Paenibacillus gorillae]|uniref:ABC transporter ATP-binding protein n=1 Tax=Paenibacillus gorillae TaxID=1243662 RepID=UPI0004B8588E|nr:ABC transporter ATP-binding protein [Paenibacillus gorillae]